MSFINKLEGLRVSKTISVQDYHQVYFDNESILTIYNIFSVVNNHSSSNIKVLEGLKVNSILVVEDDHIEFEFDNNVRLNIKIDEESFVGPEALELHIPNEPIMVWN